MKIINISNKKEKKYSVVSLFAGAGGLDIGFENQGFDTIWANDIDKDACKTHKAWSNAEVVCGDITKINFNEIPSSHVITGGFPCQGFSLAGPRKIDDKRNILYRSFVNLVAEKQPLCFVAENVKGILTLGDGMILEAIIEDFSDKGYNVFPNLVNAADYGVPQDRWRVIFLGFKKEMGIEKYIFPLPQSKKISLRQALSSLPAPRSEDICDAPFSPRYMSRNRKRSWDDVSYTIPAMAKQVTLHPGSPDMCKIGQDHWEFGQNGDTRRFSWQEAAVIQTFDKDMYFHGNLTSKYKQIGNAVPVKLAEVIAKEIYSVLEIYYSEKFIEKVG